MIDASPYCSLWLAEKGFRLKDCTDPIWLGWREGEVLRAVVVYDGFNGHNVWMHIVSDGTRRWLRREYLHAAFDYPLNVLGAKRISGRVNASNAAAIRFDEHLGFSLEARLEKAAGDGGDLLFYRMWREECRFL